MKKNKNTNIILIITLLLMTVLIEKNYDNIKWGDGTVANKK